MKKHILLLFLLVGGSLAVKGQSTDNVDVSQSDDDPLSL